MEKRLSWRPEKLKAGLRLKLIHFMTFADPKAALIAMDALKWFVVQKICA